MALIYLDCNNCEHCFAVTIPDKPSYLAGWIKAIAARDGYVCPPCGGRKLDDPTPFPARYATIKEIKKLEAEN